MLSLHAPTSPAWLVQIDGHLEELLIDHAHCEKKAAGVAMDLIFAYVDKEDLCRALSEIVREELEHFNMVLDVLKSRGMKFRRLAPSSYGQRLAKLVCKQGPQRAVDRMLVAGLIEARSCERFGMLGEHLAGSDPELADFFSGLFESEARHHSTYVRFAKEFADEAMVHTRLVELAEREAEIIAEGDPFPRMHS